MTRARVTSAGRVLCTILGWGLLVDAGPARAQEFRGSISGRVTDTTGAALPGASVTATNQATNVKTASQTSDAGDYHLMYLAPGVYSVAAELTGFKTVIQGKVEVRVGDRMTLPLRMEVGAQAETVEVTATVPLLDTQTASAGQVIDEKRIALMPLADGNPFVLARLAPGVAYVSNLLFTRPFDNNATSGLRSDGGPGRNEFTLDGTPNMATGGEQDHGRVAFVPPSEAVQEFKVETASFDAQQGHTAGANVNVTTKSGANRFAGSGYGFYRDEKLGSNDFFRKKKGQEKDPLSYQRYGGTLGGPIRKNQTFFFVSYEGLQDEFPEPSTLSVPTMAQRNGDFSALLAQGIQLYDPLSATIGPNGRVVRRPFPGNIIPANRISPMGRAVLGYFPEPNQAGDADGRNNYFTGNPRADDFYSVSARIDHSLSADQKVFVRYSRNSREETRNYLLPEINGVTPVGTGLRRMNNNLSVDYTNTMSNTTLLNVRAGFSRFRETNFRPHEGFDPATLGFSGQTLGLFRGASYFPTIDLDQYQDLGNALGTDTTSAIYTVQSTLTKIKGAHSIRAGVDLRAYRDDVVNPGNQAGTYQFRGGFTSAGDGIAAPRFGGDLVMLLLGLPTGGSIDRNGGRLNQVLYGGVFIQDDWRVTDKLTLNLGLRYDVETGMTESENRNVRGFDLTTASPLEAPARTAYTRNPVPQLPADQFQVRGGYAFASDQDRGVWKADTNNIQPRLGLVYKVNEKTVLRGGFGVYYAPFAISNVNQAGFSQATNVPTSPDVGRTFPASLANPFPLGVQEPRGASLGLLTNVGRDEDVRPVDRETPRALRFLFGLQRELPGGLLVEAHYVGNRASDLEATYSINPIPRQYLSTSALRDQATINFLESDRFANPFFGNPLIPPTETLRTTQQLTRGRLLRPYPHFSDLDGRFYDGTSTYDAGQFRLEKRFTGGLSLIGAYTYAKFTEKASKLNPTDTEYEERPHFDDARHRVTASTIWEVPSSKSWTGFTKQVLAGWSLQGIFTLQTGTPIGGANGLADRYYAGDLSRLRADWNLDNYDPVTGTVRGLFPTRDFYLHDGAVQQNGADVPARQRSDQRIRRSSHLRTFPTRLDSFRTRTRPLLDASIIKRFYLSDRKQIHLRLEVFNALNYVELNTPSFDPASASFGASTEQSNLPREIQLGVKVVF